MSEVYLGTSYSEAEILNKNNLLVKLGSGSFFGGNEQTKFLIRTLHNTFAA